MPTAVAAPMRICCPICGGFRKLNDIPASLLDHWQRLDCKDRRCLRRFKWRVVAGLVQSEEEEKG